MSRRSELRALLIELFPGEGGLRRFTADHFEDLVPRVAWSRSLSNQADALVEALFGAGRVDARLFELLAQEKPDTLDRIASTRGSVLRAGGSASGGGGSRVALTGPKVLLVVVVVLALFTWFALQRGSSRADRDRFLRDMTLQIEEPIPPLETITFSRIEEWIRTCEGLLTITREKYRKDTVVQSKKVQLESRLTRLQGLMESKATEWGESAEETLVGLEGLDTLPGDDERVRHARELRRDAPSSMGDKAERLAARLEDLRFTSSRETEEPAPGQADLLFGETSLGGIKGVDDRVRIADTTAPPYSAICDLKIRTAKGLFVSTGVLVAPRLVLTAGFAVFLDQTTGEANRVEVWCGRRGDEAPFGIQVATSFSTLAQWRETQDLDYSLGAIHLTSAIEGVPPMRLAAPTDEVLRASYGDPLSEPLRLTGYPADQGTGQLWESTGRVVGATGLRIFYTNDSYGGMGGAPVWLAEAVGAEPAVIGIHLGPGAIRFSPSILRQIDEWKSRPPADAG